MTKLGRIVHRHRIFSTVLILVLLFTSIGAATFWLHPSKAKAAFPMPVLLIHGFNAQGQVPGGCNGMWGTTHTFLQNQGWNGNDIQTIGYYQNDLDCNWDLVNDHPTKCTSFPGNEGTTGEDLRYIACKFAWYIYNNYTLNHENVRIVAHSMGGMIVQWMLHAVSSGNPEFPDHLYVPIVATISTPHKGVPPGVSGFFGCSGCLQVSQMELGGQGSQLLIDLNSDTSNGLTPGGSGWGTTDWTALGSSCENWPPLGNAVAQDSAVGNLPTAHKIVYRNTPPSQGRPVCTDTDGIYFGYEHGDYLQDAQTSSDAEAYTCDNCTDPYPTGVGGVRQLSYPHALMRVLQALEENVPLPPQPTATPVPPTPTPIPPPPPTPTPPTTNRIGVITNTNELFVKEGGLDARWSDEHGNVVAAALAGLRICIVDTVANVWCKEGALDATWNLEYSGVASIALSSNRLGVLTTDGNFFLKQGPLTQNWSAQYSGVVAIAVSNNRLGVLDTNRNFFLNDGGGYGLQYSGVRAIAVTDQRIGLIDSVGTFYLKGGASDPWWQQYAGVQAIAFDNANVNRVAVLTTSQALEVNDGAGWANIDSAITAIALYQNRIGDLDTNGTYKVKDGGLSAGWANEYSQVFRIVLPDASTSAPFTFLGSSGGGGGCHPRICQVNSNS